MSKTRPPKAKIVKMHKLLDEALGLWPDVREWARTKPGEWYNMDLIDEELQDVVVVARTLRHEVEQP